MSIYRSAEQGEASRPRENQRPAKIRTIHYGLDAIGLQALRLALGHRDVEVVAAIDPHPTRAGRDVGEVTGLNRSLGLTVGYDPEFVLKQTSADVVLHASEASLPAAYPQILQALASEKNVISSCPELAYPWATYADIAAKLDQSARQAGVCILGTGANVAFIMDALPLLLAAACQEVRSVRVRRVAEVRPERMEARTKIGIGLSLEGFRAGAESGSIGHVGLRESVIMIADTMGWRLEEINETLEPVVAQERLKTDYFLVEKNYVAGLRQRVVGLLGGREVVRLELETSLAAKSPGAEIVIDGEPPIRLTIPGDIPQEQSVAAIMVNCLPSIARGGSLGLLSMRDMPMAPYRSPALGASQEPRL